MSDGYSYDALVAAAGTDNVTELAVMTGLSQRVMFRAKAAGRITDESADRVAVALGHHPAEIWPEWWTSLDDPPAPPDANVVAFDRPLGVIAHGPTSTAVQGQYGGTVATLTDIKELTE